MRKYLLHLLIILAALAVAVAFAVSNPRKDSIFYGDALGYYVYLPAVSIYHNLDSFYEVPRDRQIEESVLWHLNNTKQVGLRTEKGLVVNQYTYGIALMEAPFFWVADAWEHHRGNGFSDTYQLAIKISGMVYALLGLLITWRVLRRFFGSTVSLLTLAALFVGTNLLWFVVYQAGMSHVPLFFLYALLILWTIRVHERPRWWLFAGMGLVAGMITIVRPTDIICLLIPLFYNVYSRETLRAKLLFLRSHWAGLALMGAAFLLPVIPQLLYWKHVSGHYLYYSYGDQSFNWLKPRIFSGLWGGENGWLMYSPVMICSLLGLLAWRSYRQLAWSIFTIFPLYVYIIYSWYCFNYINGYGSRPMIHLYPLLAVPFAAFLQWAARRPFAVKAGLIAVCLFLIGVNLSFSTKTIRGVMRSEESNFAFNMQTFFRMHLRYKDLVSMDVRAFQPDPEQLRPLRTLKCVSFEDSLTDHFVPDPTGSSRYVYHMLDEEHTPEPSIVIRYNRELFRDARWFRCSGRFMYPQGPEYYKHLLVLDVKRGDDDYPIWHGCTIENKVGLAEPGADRLPGELRLDRFETNRWGKVYFFIRVPSGIREGDKVELYLWNIGKKELYMDDICLELYR